MNQRRSNWSRRPAKPGSTSHFKKIALITSLAIAPFVVILAMPAPQTLTTYGIQIKMPQAPVYDEADDPASTGETNVAVVSAPGKTGNETLPSHHSADSVSRYVTSQAATSSTFYGATDGSFETAYAGGQSFSGGGFGGSGSGSGGQSASAGSSGGSGNSGSGGSAGAPSFAAPAPGPSPVSPSVTPSVPSGPTPVVDPVSEKPGITTCACEEVADLGKPPIVTTPTTPTPNNPTTPTAGNPPSDSDPITAGNPPSDSDPITPGNSDPVGPTIVEKTSDEDHVIVAGLFQPGNSPGIENFTKLTLEATAITEIEIGGLTPGQNPDGFDQVNVSGLLTLGGILDIILFNGFIPEAGDSFEIFTFGSITGNFSDINGLNFGDNCSFSFRKDEDFGTIDFDQSSITLWARGTACGDHSQVVGTSPDGNENGDVTIAGTLRPGQVPEPGMLVIFGLGLVGMAAIRRQRRA